MPPLESLTAQQLEACLTDSLKGIRPADAKPPTLMEQLTQFKKVLQKFRTKGYSVQQIATALQQPPLNLKVSPSLVRKAIVTTRARKPEEPTNFVPIFPPDPAPQQP